MESQSALRDEATKISAVAAARSIMVIRRRFSRVSPNGTKRSMPSAVPNCPTIATPPAFVTLKLNVCAMSARRG